MQSKKFFWRAFGLWMLGVALLFLIEVFGPTFGLRMLAQQILFNISLPWSYVVALPLWEMGGLLAYVALQLFVAGLNGLVVAAVVAMIRPNWSAAWVRHGVIAAVCGCVYFVLASFFVTAYSDLSTTVAGQLTFMVLGFPAGLVLGDYTSLALSLNAAFYATLGYYLSVYLTKKRLQQTGV
jgi:hypothetical protein